MSRRRSATRGAPRELTGLDSRHKDVNGAPAAVALRAEAERDALMRIAGAAAAATRLEDVLEPTIEAAEAALSGGGLTVGRWDREAETMRILAGSTISGPLPVGFEDGTTVPLADHPLTARLLRTGMPQFATTEDPDVPARMMEVLKAAGMQSAAGVPIVADGVVWGALWATAPAGAPSFRGRDIRFLEAVAGQLGGVVDRLARFSSVSRLAYEDALTGLANRRALDESLGRVLARYRAGDGPAALLVCDVDNLKALNDERGHHAGDRALRRVADALVAACAPFPGALPARLSGDEFAVVFEAQGVDAAREVASTALDLLRAGRDVHVSLSCGVAPASPGADTPSALLRAADTAQYAAKRHGGDQTCTADTVAALGSVSDRRRLNRRSLGERLERRSAELLRALDGARWEASTIDRLELVSAGFSETLNAAAWTTSFAQHGSSILRSVRTADDRDGRLRGVRLALEDDVYDLSDYPMTRKLVEAGVGSFQVYEGDRSADPAERVLLSELGFTGVLGTVVSDLDGVHLIELYSDGGTADLSSAALGLQLLARAAAGRSAGTRQRMAQLAKRTRQLKVPLELGHRLGGLTSDSEIVDVAADLLHAELGPSLCAIDRLGADYRIELVAGRGEAVERLLEAGGWSQSAGLGLTGRTLRDREIVMVGDVRREPDYRSTRVTEDSRSELCAPLWTGQALWGVIDLQSPRVDAFDADDAQLLRTVAGQTSAALRSASLFRALESAYLGTAEALVAALEAKDSHTARHSRTITINAEAVGRELGLEGDDLRRLRFGAAFHDIGKLAIGDSILCKPGPLTAPERDRIEQHTVIGEQILAPIEFLADVRPLVRAGHERWDGRGYPDGLAGEDIPLGARIIFACDAYDAMTSDRPYRQALGDDVAASELAANAGTQFDPSVVRALLAVLQREGIQRRSTSAS